LQAVRAAGKHKKAGKLKAPVKCLHIKAGGQVLNGNVACVLLSEQFYHFLPAISYF